MTRTKAKEMWMSRGVHCPACGKFVWRNWRGVLQMHYRKTTVHPLSNVPVTDICSGGTPAVDPQFYQQDYPYSPLPAFDLILVYNRIVLGTIV